jgi:hypothetical protein
MVTMEGHLSMVLAEEGVVEEWSIQMEETEEFGVHILLVVRPIKGTT